MSVRIRIDHPDAPPGAIVWSGPSNEILTHREGIRACVDQMRWSRADLARITGRSIRSVHPWFVGKSIPEDAMLHIAYAMTHPEIPKK